MTLRTCRCPVPLPQNAREGNPGREDWCRRCLGHISKEWTSNDETFAEFMDRLAESVPFFYSKEPGKQNTLLTTKEWDKFRAQCEARERAGRGTFGHRSLGRDNTTDAAEEFADGLIYMHLHILQSIRAGEGSVDSDSALMVAYHSFMAWRFAKEAKAKRAGAP